MHITQKCTLVHIEGLAKTLNAFTDRFRRKLQQIKYKHKMWHSHSSIDNKPSPQKCYNVSESLHSQIKCDTGKEQDFNNVRTPDFQRALSKNKSLVFKTNEISVLVLPYNLHKVTNLASDMQLCNCTACNICS